jgi:EAL domain-containing protein (putative c-di-GMP-specific phosphodiesterase class I)/GGDEF domain-containing protein
MDTKKQFLFFHKSQADATGLLALIQQIDKKIHGVHLNSLEQLVQAVKKQAWQMIIICPPADGLARDILTLLKQIANKTPVIFALKECNEKIRCQMLKLGAADAVSFTETELLGLVARQWLDVEDQPIAKLQTHDPITGVTHIDSFKHRLQQRLNQGLAKQTSLLVLQFQCLRDSSQTIEPEYRNLALSDIAQYLQKYVSNDQIARLDENSFTLSIEQDSTASAQAYADELHQWLATKHVEINNKQIPFECKIGISFYHDGCSGEGLLSQAIAACGIACSRDDVRIHRYQESDVSINASVADSTWIAVIKRAIKEGRFRTVYQPIVNLCSSPSEKYEVLLRMLDDSGKEILPGEFLGAAAIASLTIDIDRWVIANACARLSERYKQGSTTQFFIKLSTESLLDESLILFIGEQLRTARLPGASLVFEITEAAACQHPAQTSKLFDALKQLNCLTALDHVGATVLNNNFQTDYVKITGSLIGDLSVNKENQAKVKKIIQDARFKKALTIAQFVQSADTLALLWQYGVNYIQGYFFQRPDTALVYEFTENDN